LAPDLIRMARTVKKKASGRFFNLPLAGAVA
jgi:hypothetical protein